MRADYSKMTSEEFQDILELVVKENADTLLSVPGAYEVFSEYFNNEVLDRWADSNPEHAYPNSAERICTCGHSLDDHLPELDSGAYCNECDCSDFEEEKEDAD